MFVKMNRNFNVQREIKNGDKFESTTSIVNQDVFNFFLSGSQFEGKIASYSINYNTLSALSLVDIQNSTKRQNGYCISITVDAAEPENISNINSLPKKKKENIMETRRAPKVGTHFDPEMKNEY